MSVSAAWYEAFDGLRTLVCAGIVLTQSNELRPLDAGAATEFLDGDERAIIDRMNEWIAFIAEMPRRSPRIRIVLSDEEATALEAEDKREAEVEALPERERALHRVNRLPNLTLDRRPKLGLTQSR